VMETDNREAVRGFADAINRDDLDTALALCHPEIEFVSMLAVTGRAYIGHQGIREYFEDVRGHGMSGGSRCTASRRRRMDEWQLP
jgi:ketosteroid isomerase-like protein